MLHLLRQSGLIRRGRRGYELKGDAPPSAEMLERLLSGYRERAQTDKDRLVEMMHYAESVECRVQIIRQYFGYEAGKPCGRCDNCEERAIQIAGTGHETAGGALDLDGRPTDRGHEVDLAAAAESEVHRADQAHDGAEVTRIETMHGTIVTTAPETLPDLNAADDGTALAKGDMVEHNRFGPGKVKDAHGDVALVRFAEGEKKVKVSFLKKAS
jgi:ATP-dependent DNA helicase RecQ